MLLVLHPESVLVMNAFVNAHQRDCRCKGCHESCVNHAQHELAVAVSLAATVAALATA